MLCQPNEVIVFKGLLLEAAILRLPALFKEDPGLLFEVEVSHEHLITVRRNFNLKIELQTFVCWSTQTVHS